MRVPRKPLSALVFAALCATSSCGGGHAEARPHDTEGASGGEVARVNGEAVTSDAFDSFLRLKLGDISGEPLDDAVRSELFDEFLRREVTAQAARRRGLRVDVPPALAKTAEEAPVAAEIASDLLVEKYYREVVLRDVDVTAEEIDDYYARHRAAYAPAGGYRVREIRVASREEAERLRGEIASGKEPFQDAARECSDAPEAKTGGVAFYAPGQLPPALERAVAALPVGGTSGVVASSFGYHIFRLEGRESDVPLARVRAKIAGELRARKNEQLVAADSERLLGAASVAIDRDNLRFQYEGRFEK